MGFGWLGTFRQGQWQAFRSFALNERRDIGRRIAVIEAELARIGRVTVYYTTHTDEDGVTTVSEQRAGFGVTHGSSLEKLVQAYVALGGNPLDISMFLAPDSTLLLDPTDTATEVPTQPSGGVVYPKSGDYSLGSASEGGRLSVNKDEANRVGGFRELPEQRPATVVAQIRSFVDQVVDERLHSLEARIIKLMDLREQLLGEVDILTMAIGGTSGDVPSLDADFFSVDLGVAKLVAAIDSAFYQTDTDGVTPLFDSPDLESLANFPSLLLDVVPDEDNTAL